MYSMVEFDEKSFAQDGRVLSTVVSQADDIELSEATDVAGIVEDFNDLILTLKNFGVIAPFIYIHPYFNSREVLNIGRGHGRGRVKDFATSAVMAVALRITVVTV